MNDDGDNTEKEEENICSFYYVPGILLSGLLVFSLIE